MIYESICPKCNKLHVYKRTIDERNNTPKCCGVVTVRKYITPPMATIIGKAAG